MLILNRLPQEVITINISNMGVYMWGAEGPKKYSYYLFFITFINYTYNSHYMCINYVIFI